MTKFKFTLLWMAIFTTTYVASQSATFNSYAFSSNFSCDNGDSLTGNQTPMWNVDLQNDPAATQLINVDIPSGGYGECCSYANNFSCLVLEILINPNAGGVNFTLAGASGNTYIQYMNCSTTPVQAGTPICISGVGPHYFMFCRTGTTDYSITVESIPAPSGVGDLITTEGCHIELAVEGLIPSTVTWSAISPAPVNQYNNYISNVGGGQVGTSGVLYDQDLTNIWVNPLSGGPSSITLQVCGEPLINAVCPAAAPDTWCTQSTITIYPDLFAVPGPQGVICNGSVTGTTISASAVGGTAPYTYSWTGPNGFSQTNIHNNTSDNITVMNPGVYTLVLTDATGCPSATTTVNVIEYFVDIAANAGTNVTVCGSPTPVVNLNGSVSATGTGVWSGGNGTYSSSTSDLSLAYTPTASEILAGSVNLTLTPSNTAGCPFTSDQVTINLTQFNSTLNTVPTNISCFGQTNGSINLIVSPGIPTYAITGYVWSNGATTQDISNISAGTYTVTVTDANGCTGTTSASVSQPTQLTSSVVSLSNVSCFGGNNGSVTIAGSNATPSYTYSLNGGPSQTSGTFSGLTVGSYNVTVTDANGCSIIQPFTLTQPTAVNSSVTPSVYTGGYNISGCTPDGWIDLSVSGGTPGYTYSWTNGATSQDISSLSAGSYSVIVTDLNGCQSTIGITLTEPSGFSQTISAMTYPSGTNISCYGLSNGSINLTISGGTPGYSYSWNTGQTTQDLNNVPAGIYSVIVTDANGCQITSNITLTQPAPLTASMTPFVYPGGTNISCFGLSDGSIDLSIGGGNSGFVYSWSNGSSQQDLNGLSSGSYSVTATDINGCTVSSSISLNQPPVLTSGLTPSTFAGGYNLSGCNADGSINLTPGGGSPGYTYSWSNGMVTEDISNLIAGTYSVTITDINGCQTTNNITLTQPAPLTQTISALVYPSGTNISCFGFSDGSINLTIAGGTPGYTYQWGGGQISQDISNVPVGTYNVVVTDANGCQITSNISLTEPTPLTQSITGTDISCFGFSDGSLDLTIGGGSPGYLYSWSTGATTQDISGIPVGTYNVTATDINGCTITSNLSLTQPTNLNIVLTPSIYPGGYNVSGCNQDGSVDLTVTGGNPGYSYSWSNGVLAEDLTNVAAGSYSVTVTDINGCTSTSNITLTQPNPLSQTISATTYPSGTNISCFGFSDGAINLTVAGGTPGYTYLWGDGQLSQDLTNVPVGTYNVVVTDANGCQITSSITLTQPAQLTQSALAFTYPSGTNISCYGLSDGSIDLTIGGGSPGYSYLWSNGAANQDLTGLAAGTYSVIITDINGCTIPSAITLIQPVPLTQAISAMTYPSGSNISCFGLSDGTIDLTIGGGNPGYTYAWTGPVGGITEDLSAVPAGTYNLIATDINGCTITSSITLTQPTPLTQSATAFTYPSGTNISCFGLSDGSVDLTVGGGNPGYTYLWSNGYTSQDLTGVPYGSYNVTVTDINGCQITGSIVLTQPTALAQTISAFTYPSGTNISCFGENDGSINLTVTNGSPGYTYLWTGPVGGTTQDLSNLPFGTYNVTVTDVNGCQITGSVTLTQPTILTSEAALSIYAGGYNLSGCNPDGWIDLSVMGGNSGYAYVWTLPAPSAPETTQDISNLSPGSYSVVVTDMNGCQTILDTILTQPVSLTTTTQVTSDYNGQDISCIGASDGSVTVNIFGGTPTYEFEWLDSAGYIVGTSQSATGLSVGTYTINIEDQNGCIGSNTITLSEPTGINSNINVSTNYNGEDISCFGYSDGGINLSLNGGTPGYTYNWTNSSGVTISTVQDPQGLSAGQYFVLVTDLNGCTHIRNIVLTQPNPLTAITDVTSNYNGQDVSCFGSTDGAIMATTSGGTPGYSNTWVSSNGTTLGTSQNLGSVGAGTYIIEVMDINGCVYSTNVIVTEPPTLTSGITIISDFNGQAVSCVGQEDGRIQAFYSGGTPGYSIEWNTTPIQTTDMISGLGVGSYTVTVTDANGCISTSSVDLNANPLPTFILPDSVFGCMGAGIMLDSQAEPGSSCTWQFSDGQVINECGPFVAYFSNLDCYDMTLTIVDAIGCVDSISVNDFVCIKPNPLAGFSIENPEMSNFHGDTYFWNTSQGAESYEWDFGDGSNIVNTFNAYHEFSSDDDFNTVTFPVTLYAITEYGCIDTAVLFVDLSPDLIFFVPNAFTPDNDEFNNIFKPIFASGYSYESYNFMIFNRWGDMIFETEEIHEGWDGTFKGSMVQDGVYTWKLNVKNSVSDHHEEHVGHVSILR